MLKVRIETKNGTFKGNLHSETIRCLKNVIKIMESGCSYLYTNKECNISDINGNKVGYFKLTNR